MNLDHVASIGELRVLVRRHIPAAVFDRFDDGRSRAGSAGLSRVSDASPVNLC